MKKTIFMAIVGFAMLATSCSTGTKVVQFTELKNYFYRNDAPKGDQLLKLTTQEDFNRYFGEAAYMGTDGEPTKINFNEDFVIAKVFPESNKSPEISNISLEKDGKGELILGYEVKEKSTQSFTIRPTFQIAVSRKYINDNLKGATK